MHLSIKQRFLQSKTKKAPKSIIQSKDAEGPHSILRRLNKIQFVVIISNYFVMTLAMSIGVIADGIKYEYSIRKEILRYAKIYI